MVQKLLVTATAQECNPSKPCPIQKNLLPRAIVGTVFGRSEVNLSNHNSETANLNQAFVSTIPTSNSFAPLYEASTQMDDSNILADEDLTQQIKPHKTAPIVVVDSNPTALQNFLCINIPSKKFELKIMSIGIRIFIPSHDEYEKAMVALRANHFKFYKYHTTDTRPIKIVLYGLPDMDVDSLRKTLQESNILPIEIKKLNLRQKQFNDQAIYLLHFKPASVKLADLRNIIQIGFLRVRWDKYHPRNITRYLSAKIAKNLATLP